MAIIYDIATGTVISAPAAGAAAENPVRDSGCMPAPRPALATREPEPEQPCTPYLALLQQVLKDL